MQLTAKRRGYFQVFVNDNHQTNHTTEREALQRAIELKGKYPSLNVHIEHDYHVQVGKAVEDTFTIYDCTKLFQDSPMTNIGISYHNQLWDNKDFSVEYPQSHNITRETAEMRSINSRIGVIDIELRKVNTEEVGFEQVQQNVKWLCNIFDLFKSELPDMQLGYYSMVPSETYTSSFVGELADIFDDKNKYLQPLADKVDFLAPCFYTRWTEEDRDSWIPFAIRHIEKCREMASGKPVLPFISPIWYNVIYGAENGSHFREYVSGDYWQMKIETLREHADGAIVYLPWDVDPEEARSQEWFQGI